MRCSMPGYRTLVKIVRAQGYEIIPVNPDWLVPLSKHVFRPQKNAVLIGFSYGAVLAYLIAKKYPCRKVIFASLSPIHTFTYKMLVEEDSKIMPRKNAIANAKDIKKIKIQIKSLKAPYISLRGELEKEMEGELLVPKTGHEMTPAYINAVTKLL